MAAHSTLHPVSLVWAGHEIARVLPTPHTARCSRRTVYHTPPYVLFVFVCWCAAASISPLSVRHFRQERDMRGSTNAIGYMAPVPTVGLTAACIRAYGVKAAFTGTVSPFVCSPVRVFMLVHVYRDMTERVSTQPGLKGHLRRNAKNEQKISFMCRDEFANSLRLSCLLIPARIRFAFNALSRNAGVYTWPDGQQLEGVFKKDAPVKGYLTSAGSLVLRSLPPPFLALSVCLSFCHEGGKQL